MREQVAGKVDLSVIVTGAAAGAAEYAPDVRRKTEPCLCREHLLAHARRMSKCIEAGAETKHYRRRCRRRRQRPYSLALYFSCTGP